MCGPIDPRSIDEEENALRTEFAAIPPHIRFIERLPAPDREEARERHQAEDQQRREAEQHAIQTENREIEVHSRSHHLNVLDIPDLFPRTQTLPLLDSPAHGFAATTEPRTARLLYNHPGTVMDYLHFPVLAQVVPSSRAAIRDFEPLDQSYVAAAASGLFWGEIDVGMQAWGWWARPDGTLWGGLGTVVVVYENVVVPWVEGDREESDGTSGTSTGPESESESESSSESSSGTGSGSGTPSESALGQEGYDLLSSTESDTDGNGEYDSDDCWLFDVDVDVDTEGENMDRDSDSDSGRILTGL